MKDWYPSATVSNSLVTYKPDLMSASARTAFQVSMIRSEITLKCCGMKGLSNFFAYRYGWNNTTKSWDYTLEPIDNWKERVDRSLSQYTDPNNHSGHSVMAILNQDEYETLEPIFLNRGFTILYGPFLNPNSRKKCKVYIFSWYDMEGNLKRS